MGCAWIALMLTLSVADGSAQDRFAITPVGVVDVTDGLVRANQTVLIEGARITRVGAAAGMTIPDGTEVVDGTGGYLIPGLWDMHGHAVAADRVDTFFRLFIANGITGVRDPFGSLAVAARAERAVAVHEVAGPPRIVAAGNLIDGAPRSTVPGAVTASSPDRGRTIVDPLHAVGAPFIKVYSGVSPETYHAIAERSREVGLPFTRHVPTLVRAADAARAGQRSMEHLIGVLTGCSAAEEEILADWRRILGGGDMAVIIAQFMQPVRRALDTQDEIKCRHLMELFVEHGTWQVPTLVSLRGKAYLRELAAEGDPRDRYFAPPSRWTGGSPFGFPLNEEQWQIFQAQYEHEKQIVGVMAAAGVPILAGSDVATPWVFPGFGLHDELQLLVEAGLTPLQALQAATLNPARFFGRTADLGHVAPGKLADLVLLESNPLDDIGGTRHIRAVIANGRLYRCTRLSTTAAISSRMSAGARTPPRACGLGARTAMATLSCSARSAGAGKLRRPVSMIGAGSQAGAWRRAACEEPSSGTRTTTALRSILTMRNWSWQ
jgi:hypothetical protein